MTVSVMPFLLCLFLHLCLVYGVTDSTTSSSEDLSTTSTTSTSAKKTTTSAPSTTAKVTDTTSSSSEDLSTTRTTNGTSPVGKCTPLTVTVSSSAGSFSAVPTNTGTFSGTWISATPSGSLRPLPTGPAKVKRAVRNLGHAVEERAPSKPTATTIAAPPNSPQGIEWDESCANYPAIGQIIEAWEDAVVIAGAASNGLSALTSSLPNAPGTGANTDNRRLIAQTNPSYTQMFKAIDNKLGQVSQVFDRMTRLIPNTNDPARSTNGRLRIVCNGAPIYKGWGSKTTVCGKRNPAQALTFNPDGGRQGERNDIEARYRITDSTLIVFCPAWYSGTSVPGSQALTMQRVLEGKLRGGDQSVCDLGQVDSQARVLVHEWTHINWIKPPSGTGDEGGYGWEESANTANAGYNAAAANADNYAWFAVYHYWNNMNQGGHTCPVPQGATCQDVWPTGANAPGKPCPTTY